MEANFMKPQPQRSEPKTALQLLYEYNDGDCSDEAFSEAMDRTLRGYSKTLSEIKENEAVFEQPPATDTGCRDYHDVPFPEGTQPATVKEQGSHAAEWTAEHVSKLLEFGGGECVSDAHNAALAAEQKQTRIAEDAFAMSHNFLLHSQAAIEDAIDAINDDKSYVALARLKSVDLDALVLLWPYCPTLKQ